MNERIRIPDGASAAACKLLKGLLNRDAGKRLGAARGTMLELGGVGALKQQAFFSGLDFGKLELKQIEPPENFNVDHDEDLRHFHDEFVNMTLPRSVKEMSSLDFLPKRCVSQNFRGFSFIGDSFPTPDRTASEQEHYWNNVDEDGQSQSDCASRSSLGDEHFGDLLDPEPVPEKKKRPARKKKKKQQLVPPLETTNENEAHEMAFKDTTTCSDGGNTNAEMKAKKVEKKCEQLDAPNNEKQTESKFELAIKPLQAADTHAHTPARPTTPAPQASMVTQSIRTQTAQVSSQKSVATLSYTPKPGTWASLTQGKGKVSPTIQQAASPPLKNGPTTATTAVPIFSPRAPPTRQTSSDWTTHAVSPRRKALSPKSTSKQSLIASSYISQPAQNAWPSLGDFPPPPGAKPKEQKKSSGVWGKRS